MHPAAKLLRPSKARRPSRGRSRFVRETGRNQGSTTAVRRVMLQHRQVEVKIDIITPNAPRTIDD